jgi:hypothetical protein
MKEQLMKRFLTHSALALIIALGMATPAALAQGKKPKHSAEHIAAVKKCNADYSAALKSAKTLKGRERSEARAKAKADRKQCLADAPK